MARRFYIRGFQLKAVFVFILATALSFTAFSNANRRNAMPIDPEAVKELLEDGLDTKLKDSDRIEALRYAANFPYKDVVDALVSTLKEQVQIYFSPQSSSNLKSSSLSFVIHIVESLSKVATANSWPAIYAELEKFKGTENPDPEMKKLMSSALAASKLINSRPTVLPQLPKITQKLLTDGMSLKDKQEHFKKILTENIKGQPHVVEMLIKLRAKDNFYGFRENPAFAWFLGPPGTGKDTAVYAYLHAIHSQKEAHKTHLYRVDPLRHQGDLWSLLGSATGYVGSSGFPPILRFLVQHSGGRYTVVEESDERGKSQFKIVENPNWQPGSVLPGYSSPDRGVIYLDEFHDWSMDYKNAIVKKAAEYGGYWKVNNPNGGVSEIYVPINIFAASNDGMELVTSREKNGERFGKPLTYEQMKERFERVKNNKPALRQSIKRGSGFGGEGSNAKGTSEELLNRVPDDYLVLFGPLSPEHLKEIAHAKLLDLNTNIKKSKQGYQNLSLTWDSELLDFIQEYNYFAEDQARPIQTKVKSLIEDTLIEAAENGVLKAQQKTQYKISAHKKPDNTWELVLENTQNPGEESIRLDITATHSQRLKGSLSDDKIDYLAQIPSRLKESIIGQSHVIDKISKALTLSEEGRQGSVLPENAKEPARTFMLLGPTSTGKTETAKVIAEVLFSSRLNAVTIDATSLQTIQKLHEKFFGYKDSLGRPVPSDFMKHYDRNNGQFVLILDELANVADKNVLNALFDLLREPVVSTFCDGQERVMSNVVIMITGNASQELLARLPQNLPENVLREAWMNIYDQLESDPHLRRSVLESYFTPPLLARIGDDRTFFYKPLSYSDVRQLTQMKFESLLKKLGPKDGQRGWSFSVENITEYTKIIEALETHGFKLKEQGASIDNYINEVFGKELKYALLTAKVPDSEDVQIRFSHMTQTTGAAKRHQLHFAVKDSKGVERAFVVDGKPVQNKPVQSKQDLLITAAHEAGHAVVKMALLKDFEFPTNLRIIPGVANIGGEWIYYSGLASSELRSERKDTREYYIRQMAVLMGGTAAENLVVAGGYESAGRTNDIERATAIAKKAILEFGMSKAFGRVKVEESSLSEKDKALLLNEVELMIAEAESLARTSILANKDGFVDLTNKLAASGEVSEEEILATFNQTQMVTETSPDFNKRAMKNSSHFNQTKNDSIWGYLQAKLGFSKSKKSGVNYTLVESLELVTEESVVDLDKLLTEKMKKELASVDLVQKASLTNVVNRLAPSCRALVGK